MSVVLQRPATGFVRRINSTFRPFRDRASRNELRLLFSAQPVVPVVLLAARLLGPLAKVPKLGWIVTDPLVARAVFNDSKHFTMLDEGTAGHWWKQVLGEWILDLFDGTGHLALRTAVRDLFAAEFTHTLVARAGDASLVQLRADLAAGKAVDMVAWSRVMIGRILADLVGMSLADIASVFPEADPNDEAALFELLTTEGESLSNYAMGVVGGDFTPDQLRESHAVVARVTTFVPRAYANAGTDTVLGRMRDSGVPLEHAIGLMALMVVAGTQTTVSTIPRMFALLHDSGEQHTLLADLGNIENTVRESLRVTSAAASVGRNVSHDVVVGGKQLRAGDQVKIFLWTINNGIGPFQADREYVPELRQLWFASGRHLCIASTLVNIELARILEAVTSEGRPWEIVTRSARTKLLVASYEKLEIRLVDGS